MWVDEEPWALGPAVRARVEGSPREWSCTDRCGCMMALWPWARQSGQEFRDHGGAGLALIDVGVALQV